MSEKTVAVAMIVKNEEALLARCLESVKGLPIYIVDTGSQDRTVEIARQYTDNVYLDYVWADSFGEARNWVKSKVKEDFILSIDADEQLLCSIEEVKRVVQLADKFVACGMIAEGEQKLGFFFGRLFRNSPDIFWVQDVHNHLNMSGEGEHIGDVRIMFGYSPAHNNDPDRTLRILEKTVREEKEPSRNLYYLGREYWYKRRYNECIETLKRYLQVSKWNAERADAYLIASQAHHIIGRVEEAKLYCLQAINLNANFKEAILFMANITKDDDSKQWHRMARTANNKDVLWDREPAVPFKDIVAIIPHNDDESLFLAYTLIRSRPLVIVVTDSYIQPERGGIFSGCTAEVRRQETIEAMKIAGCPVLFMGIKDTELTEEIFRERIKHLNPETIYAPAVQGGNLQHDIIGKVCYELFKGRCERYTTYTKTDLYTTSNWEIVPTIKEIETKNAMLDCYKSQINLPSTKPHFDAVRNKSEWLM